MERDFLGLNSREYLEVAKEEFKDVGKDTAFLGPSGMQWTTFPSKISALPKFMSFKTSQEDRPKKLIFDPHVPSVFQAVTTSDAFDPNQKISVGQSQSFNMERQSTNFTFPTYLTQPVDGMSVIRSHDMRSFPVSNHHISVATSNPFFKVHGTKSGSASIMQQPLGGIPITTSHSVIPMTGTYALRNNSKPSTGSAQLTVFYGGTVNVYDDISAEEAQAIMFLAGNGNTNPTTHRTPVNISAPVKPEPWSGLSSPISVTCHSNAQSGSGSSHPEDLLSPESVGALTAPSSSKPEPSPQIPVSTSTSLIPAVPLARKASLARFLEKRKERVLNAAPYGIIPRKSPDSSSESEVAGKFPLASMVLDLMSNNNINIIENRY
ncbi:protein TIFY 6B-like isoform X2 [Aristolochia californica]|uniref:protein TIFY 6B-like isoform X2 n=1 Tax=Aristolochia californica TaxID=171875 RepID=UPI0035D8847D